MSNQLPTAPIDLSKFIGQKVQITFAYSFALPASEYFIVGYNDLAVHRSNYPYILADQHGQVLTSYTKRGTQYVMSDSPIRYC